MSDYKGAALILPVLPRTKVLLGDKGYDADWLRQTLADLNITACIPSKANRKIQIPHDAALYRRRHKIEITFGRLNASTRATIDARTPSCPPSLSPPPSNASAKKQWAELWIQVTRLVPKHVELPRNAKPRFTVLSVDRRGCLQEKETAARPPSALPVG